MNASAQTNALLPRSRLSLLSSTCAPQGKDAIRFLEGLVVGDVAGLADGTGTLSVFTNERGGIIDDTVVTKVRVQGHRHAPGRGAATIHACGIVTPLVV